jgi:hypothetical protein
VPHGRVPFPASRAGHNVGAVSRTIVTAVRDLHPGYFAFVMVTGIISTGFFLLGPPWLSRVMLVAACAGLVVLGATAISVLADARPRISPSWSRSAAS